MSSVSFSSLAEKAPIFRKTLLHKNRFHSDALAQHKGKISLARSEVIHLCSIAGQLCHYSLGGTAKHMENEISTTMATLLLTLVFLAHEVCGLNLAKCIQKKIALNNRKYPAELCRGQSGKYTKYSAQTGITKTEGQSTVDIEHEFDDQATVSSLTEQIVKFSADRQWNKHHTPRNILLALMGEMGELAEIFQWEGDDKEEKDDADRVVFWDKVGQELADVSIYLLRLANVSNIDLSAAALKS